MTDNREKLDIAEVFVSLNEQIGLLELSYEKETFLRTLLITYYLVKSRIFHRRSIENDCKCGLDHNRMLFAIEVAIKAFEEMSDILKCFDLKRIAEGFEKIICTNFNESLKEDSSKEVKFCLKPSESIT